MWAIGKVTGSGGCAAEIGYHNVHRGGVSNRLARCVGQHTLQVQSTRHGRDGRNSRQRRSLRVRCFASLRMFVFHLFVVSNTCCCTRLTAFRLGIFLLQACVTEDAATASPLATRCPRVATILLGRGSFALLLSHIHLESIQVKSW